MVDFYRELAPTLPGKIVVYNGDTDPCVSYEGTRTAIEKVGFAVAQPYRPWFFNFTAADPTVPLSTDPNPAPCRPEPWPFYRPEPWPFARALKASFRLSLAIELLSRGAGATEEGLTLWSLALAASRCGAVWR